MLLLFEFLQFGDNSIVLSPLLSITCGTLPRQQEHLLAKLLNCKFPYCSIQLTSCFKLPPNVCVTSIFFSSPLVGHIVESYSSIIKILFFNSPEELKNCKLEDFSSKICYLLCLNTSLYIYFKFLYEICKESLISESILNIANIIFLPYNIINH